MSDLISRNDAVEAIEFEKVYMTAYRGSSNGYVSEGNPFTQYNKGLDDAIKAINSLTPAEPELEIIRCENCKWWDRLEDGHPYGYCRACRSGTYTERWEISIYRQNKYDFYCADAEPRIEGEDDDE